MQAVALASSVPWSARSHFGELAGDLPARRLVGRRRPGLELGPEILRDLGGEIAHPVRQAALAGRAREADLDRLDHARRPIADHQERVAQAEVAHVLEERRDRLNVLL